MFLTLWPICVLKEKTESELLSCDVQPSNQRTTGWNYNKTFNSVSALQVATVHATCWSHDYDHVCHTTAMAAIYIPYLVHSCYQNIVREFSWPQGKYIEKHKTCTAKWFSILNSWSDKTLQSFKCPLMIKFSISTFYIFVHNRAFLYILPNFNWSIMSALELAFFGPLFPRNYGPQ